MSVRVRFAPSPTGPLHIGGVRTALYNYLFAKRHGGSFILRIEDTDHKRFVDGAQQYIEEALSWCGIEPDEGPNQGGSYGPYVQSERKDLYAPFAKQLIEGDKAYYAFDTAEELDAAREAAKKAGLPGWQYNHITRSSMRNSLSLSEDEVDALIKQGTPYVIRAKMPRNREVRFHDEIRGWVVVNTNNLDDKVLFKSGGMPTYHMANIIDDHQMSITHVIRGEEWLPSAPLHILLYEFLGWDAPKFAHLPLLLRPDGNGKLSKRDGDRLGFPVFPLRWTDPETKEVSSGYREDGYYPDAFMNMLALLGWNPGTNEEIFSMEELIRQFSLERVGKSGAKFDPEKARWFNQQYLRAKSNQDLAKELVPLLEASGVNISETPIEPICEMLKERATFVKDMVSEGLFFFVRPVEYDAKTTRKKWKEGTADILEAFKDQLSSLTDFSAASIEQSFKAFLESKELGIGAVLPNFRLIITGRGMGPSMFDICAVLGKEEVLERMQSGLEKVPALKASMA